jgi:hypothetical protein
MAVVAFHLFAFSTASIPSGMCKVSNFVGTALEIKINQRGG